MYLRAKVMKGAAGSSSNRRIFLSYLLPHLERMLSPWMQTDSTQSQKDAVLEIILRLLQLDTASVLANVRVAKLICEVIALFMSRGTPSSVKIQARDVLPFVMGSKDISA